MLEIPHVVDPSDQVSITEEFWNIPAVLIDSVDDGGYLRADLGEIAELHAASVAPGTARLVRRTLAMMAASSSGRSVRRSNTSASIPSAASLSAAARHL